MRPYLAYISVLFLSEFLKCFAGYIISDISDDCAKGQTISTYLTRGMGKSDSFVALIAKQSVSCSLKFLVSEGNYVIVVIEFLDWSFGKNQCGHKANEVTMTVREKNIINICYEVEDNIIWKHAQGELSIIVKGVHDMQTMKVTATSARVSRSGKCDDYEVQCIYEDEIFCMTNEVKCDGNVNCGVRDKYDEDLASCENYNTVSPDMVIVGIVIVFVTFCMMVAILRKLVPNREGTFMIKEDETLSEKDRAAGEREFQINYKVLTEPGDTEPKTSRNTEVFQEPPLHRGTHFRKSKLWKKS